MATVAVGPLEHPGEGGVVTVAAGAVGGDTKAQSAGLTTTDATRRLTETGPNSLPDTTLHPLIQAAKKFWASVPWMLKAA